MTALFTTLLGLIQFIVANKASEPYRSTCSKIGEFNQVTKDHVLSNHVFATHSVTTRFECATHCLGNSRCKSYNYQYTGTECQLNDASKTGLGAALTSQTGYSYYENNVNSKLGCRSKGYKCNRGSCNDTCDGVVCDCRNTGCKGRYCHKIDEKTFQTESTILATMEPELIYALGSFIESKGCFPWKVCFRGTSQGGFTNNQFNLNCDRRGPTLSVIRVGQFFFGGFTSRQWQGNRGVVKDSLAFIYSLRNNDQLPPFKLKVKETGINAIYNTNYCLFAYGTEDICIQKDNAASSTINLGNHYELPSGYSLGQANTLKLLAGASSFTVDEFEMFYMVESGINDSVILKNKPSLTNQLRQWLNVTNKWRRCHLASQHGWLAATFHENCDKMGPTVTLIEVGEYIFGGYSGLDFTSDTGGYQTCPTCFLFSLVNSEGHPPFKSLIQNSRVTYGFFGSSNYGPIFGGGHDILISNLADQSATSYSNFGNTYQVPEGVTNRQILLAGTNYFIPTNMEVFYQAGDDLLYHSVIMSQESEDLRRKLFSFFAVDMRVGWSKCFQATRDGWSSTPFLKNCRFETRTLFIYKIGTYIFGGYAFVNWADHSLSYQQASAFLFTLRNYVGLAPFKMTSSISPQHSVYTGSSGRVGTFGGGADLAVNGDGSGYSNLGHTYSVPSNVPDKKSLLAGSYNFQLDEIEVFYSI